MMPISGKPEIDAPDPPLAGCMARNILITTAHCKRIVFSMDPGVFRALRGSIGKTSMHFSNSSRDLIPDHSGWKFIATPLMQ
jgi:hypothetical protein